MEVVARDLLTYDFPALSVRASISDAWEFMLSTGVVTVFLIDDQHRLLGAISDYEILKALHFGLSLNDSVASLMNTDVIVISPNVSVASVERLFRERRCSQIAVVEANRFIGCVTRQDMMRLFKTMQVLEKLHLEELQADSDGLLSSSPDHVVRTKSLLFDLAQRN